MEVKSFAFEGFSAFVLEVGICFEFSLLRMYSHGIGSCVRLFCESVALHWFADVFLPVCLSTLVGSVCLSESVVRRSCGEEVGRGRHFSFVVVVVVVATLLRGEDDDSFIGLELGFA